MGDATLGFEIQLRVSLETAMNSGKGQCHGEDRAVVTVPQGPGVGWSLVRDQERAASWEGSGLQFMCP